LHVAKAAQSAARLQLRDAGHMKLDHRRYTYEVITKFFN